MRVRLIVEDRRGPADVRFLTVLQGADGGATPTPARRLQTTGGARFEGAVVGSVIVLFPAAPPRADAPIEGLSYTAPRAARAHVITGLLPGARYDVSRRADGARIHVAITRGAAHAADEGGVLVIGDRADLRP